MNDGESQSTFSPIDGFKGEFLAEKRWEDMRDGSFSGKVRTPLRCLSAGYLNLDVVGVVLMEELGKQTEALVFSRWIQS